MSSYRFRALRDGSEHVWTGEELRERGVELELGPYDYRVFVTCRPELKVRVLY